VPLTAVSLFGIRLGGPAATSAAFTIARMSALTDCRSLPQAIGTHAPAGSGDFSIQFG